MDNQGFEDKPEHQSSQEPLPNNNNVDTTTSSVDIGPPQAMNHENNCFNRMDRNRRQITATLGGAIKSIYLF